MTGKVAALVLAAGRSERFGAADKLLVPYAGRPLLTHSLAAVSGATVAARWLVCQTGADYTALAREFGFKCLENLHAAEGMATSIALGAKKAKEGGFDALMILLADMPGVDAALVDALVAQHAGRRDVIVQPQYAGRGGHPVVFGAAFFDALAALQGDTGARSILSQNTEAVEPLAWTDNAIFYDIDRPHDIRQAAGNCEPKGDDP